MSKFISPVVSKNDKYIRYISRKFTQYDPVLGVLNEKVIVWTPPGMEVYTLDAVYAKVRSRTPFGGSVTTPPQVSFEANLNVIIPAGVLPIAPGDIWRLAAPATGIPIQITRAAPLMLKLTADVVLGTATGILYDFLFSAIKFEDFGF